MPTTKQKTDMHWLEIDTEQLDLIRRALEFYRDAHYDAIRVDSDHLPAINHLIKGLNK